MCFIKMIVGVGFGKKYKGFGYYLIWFMFEILMLFLVIMCFWWSYGSRIYERDKIREGLNVVGVEE